MLLRDASSILKSLRLWCLIVACMMAASGVMQVKTTAKLIESGEAPMARAYEIVHHPLTLDKVHQAKVGRKPYEQQLVQAPRPRYALAPHFSPLRNLPLSRRGPPSRSRAPPFVA